MTKSENHYFTITDQLMALDIDQYQLQTPKKEIEPGIMCILKEEHTTT